jgi:hypothetical protein
VVKPLVHGDEATGLWAARLATGKVHGNLLAAMGALDGLLSLLPFAIGLAAALVLAAAAAGWVRLSLRQVGVGLALTAVWAAFAATFPPLAGVDASADQRAVASGGERPYRGVDYGRLPLAPLVTGAFLLAAMGTTAAFLALRLRRAGGDPKPGARSLAVDPPPREVPAGAGAGSPRRS